MGTGSPVHLAAGGWRLEAGGWRLAAGGWRLEAGGWRLAAGGWRLAAGGWRLAAGSQTESVAFFTNRDIVLIQYAFPGGCVRGAVLIRVTKESDYAIMLLAFMASQPRGEVHSAKEAASWSGLPLPMVSKILRGLAREKILVSHRGATGGYSFERSPDEISVADVVRAIEGPISLVQCGAEPGACEKEEHCPTRMNWTRISREVEAALERVSIAEMFPVDCAQPLITLQAAAEVDGSATSESRVEG